VLRNVTGRLGTMILSAPVASVDRTINEMSFNLVGGSNSRSRLLRIA
jgi:hypothetical protein